MISGGTVSSSNGIGYEWGGFNPDVYNQGSFTLTGGTVNVNGLAITVVLGNNPGSGTLSGTLTATTTA